MALIPQNPKPICPNVILGGPVSSNPNFSLEFELGGLKWQEELELERDLGMEVAGTRVGRVEWEMDEEKGIRRKEEEGDLLKIAAEYGAIFDVSKMAFWPIGFSK